MHPIQYCNLHKSIFLKITVKKSTTTIVSAQQNYSHDYFLTKTSKRFNSFLYLSGHWTSKVWETFAWNKNQIFIFSRSENDLQFLKPMAVVSVSAFFSFFYLRRPTCQPFSTIQEHFIVNPHISRHMLDQHTYTEFRKKHEHSAI